MGRALLRHLYLTPYWYHSLGTVGMARVCFTGGKAGLFSSSSGKAGRLIQFHWDLKLFENAVGTEIPV